MCVFGIGKVVIGNNLFNSLSKMLLIQGQKKISYYPAREKRAKRSRQSTRRCGVGNCNRRRLRIDVVIMPWRHGRKRKRGGLI